MKDSLGSAASPYRVGMETSRYEEDIAEVI